MKRWFRLSPGRRSGKKSHRRAYGKAARPAGVFRAVGWEQLEGRMLLTAQLVVNTTADDLDGGTVANPSGPDGTLSLREAITVANLDGGANITFNIPNDSVQNPQTIGLTSALPALGNGITIAGPGANELTISGRNQFQVFDVSSGSTVSISGLTIANGFTDTPAKHGTFTFVAGGAISNDGNLTLSDDVLSNNFARSGDTLGLATGGAIINEGTLSISGSSLTANSVSAIAGSSFTAQGGAIDNHGSLTITDSTLSGNSASAPGSGSGSTLPTALGGALANVEGGVANITGTTISGNTATGFVTNGAGIFEGVFAGALPSGSLTLIDSTLSDNAGAGTNGQGAGGGGASVRDGKISLLNCTVAGNTVTGPNSGGGGLSLSAAQASLINCTVSGNAVENSAGGGSGGGIGGGTVNLTNTIVARNTVDAGGFGPDLALLSVGTDDHNLIGIGGSGSGGLTNGQNGDQVGTAASPLGPKLGPLSNNGGPTQTMALVVGSPAIDAGDNTVVTSPPFANPPTDQRGTGFPRIVNGTVDIGAFEFSPLPNLVVTTTADDLDGGTLANPDGPDGTLSLREAVTLANLEGGANITFAIPGDSAATPQTITLTSALPALNAAITIAGPGANELTVSGNDKFQPFNVTSGSVVSISGLTIAHGFNNTPALNGGVLPFVAGGAIFNAGTLTLASDVLTNNAATNSNNNGFAAGGAVYNTATLTVSTCMFSGNSVSATTGNTSGAAGGAIYSFGNSASNPAALTITDSTLTGNSVSDPASGSTGGEGGAIEVDGATSATITGTTISGNTASGGVGEGGGIYDATLSNFDVNIIGSTIAGNTATASLVGGLAEGGGINEFGNGPLSLTNCTIANNTVTSADRGVGGGLATFVSTATVTNCTVTGNADNFTNIGSAPASGGGGIWDSGSTFGMTNTIVAGNTEAAGGTGADFSNGQSSGDVVNPDDHNLIGIGDGSGLTNGKNGDQVGTAASPLDAKLGTLANNGGPTQTIALLAGSPAIDAGDNAAVNSPTFAGPPFTDQRGTGFPRIINGTVDIGAFEVLPNLVVTTTADDLDGGTVANPDGPDGTLSLREAITVANLEGGAIITFNIPGDSAATPQTITLTSALPAITGTVTITGPGANELTVSGNNQFQVFDVQTTTGTVTIDDMTIANGSSTGSGGGILNNGTLDLSGVTVSGNTANGGGGIDNEGTLNIANSTITGNTSTQGDGGGIYSDGDVVISDSTVGNNSAPEAGGIECRGTLTVIDSTFSGNTATGSDGAGAIEPFSIATITNSTISGNSATTGNGGGIETIVSQVTVTITNSTLSGNSAPAHGGGGIWTTGSDTITLNNTIVAGNTANAAPDVDNSGGTVIASSSLIGDGTDSGITVTASNHDLVGTAASPTDAKLGPLQNNGGQTDTMALLAGSPAIDAGSNSLAVDAQGNPLTTDQRGAGFPRIVNGTVDIGAFEAAAAAVLPTSSVAALPQFEPTSFTVSWSGTDTGGPGIADFNVFVSDNGGSFTAFKTNTTATQATFTGQPGHTYGFYSVATDTAGNTQATPTSAQATTTVPQPPTSSVAALPRFEPTSFTVSWSGTDTGGPGIADFNVFVSDNGGAVTAFKTDTTATSATFTGQAGHTYGFYSMATDTVGNTQATPTSAQTTTTVPQPPTSSVAALPQFEPTSFTVSWSGSDTGGPGIADFSVFVSDNGGSFTAFKTNTTATQATFTGQPGHTYGFYSVATDTVGNTQATPTSAQATTTVPQPPTSTVAALPNFEPTSFTVGWSGTDTGGPGIADYNVFVSDNGGSFTAFKTNTTATSATFTGQSGHTYGFYSVATDTVGNTQATPTTAQATTAVQSIQPGTITWTGASKTSANWSDPANWDLNRKPIDGDSLVFPATAQQLSNNDDISGLSVNSITFQGTFATAAGGYTLSGDDLTVGSGGIVDNGSINGVLSSIDNQIDLNVALAAAQNWSINDSDNFHHLTVNGNVTDGGFGLTATGNGTIDIAGQISGSGSLTVSGQATGGLLTVDLDHANTYTGGTHVNTGILDVFADGALGPGGTNDAGTVVGADGLLFIHGIAYSTPETLTLDGTLGSDGGTSSFAGPITITGSASGTGNGLPVPVDAQISDVGVSAGTFTLDGPTLVNNGHADLFVNGGNLSLGGNSIVVIDNTMSGTGGLFVVSGAVQLEAANTYQGSTILGGVAEVDVGVDNAIPSASAVVMQSGAGNANVVKLAGHSDTIGSLAGTESGGGANTLDLGTNGSLTTGGDNTSTSFAGDITGSGTLTKQGSGTFDLTAANDYTGSTSVQAGTLIVDGSTAAGNSVTVGGAAILGGDGAVAGKINVAGGTVDPGAGPDPFKDTGTLSNTGGVTFAPMNLLQPPLSTLATFAVELGGTATNATNDQLKSATAVSLNGVVLGLTTLAGAGPFNAGQQFVIVQAGAPITTTFAGKAEGSTVSDGAQNFTISYANDRVTLTVQPLTQNEQTASYLNGQAGDNTAATFVHNLYRELLGREPDAAGQTFWLNVYSQAGGAAAARQKVVAGFLDSPEYRQHLVSRIYVDFLHRAVEASGLQFWTGKLAGGLDEKSLLAGVIGSDEYFHNAGNSAAKFVDGLFHDLLGRTGSASDEAYWAGLVHATDSASLFQIAVEFLSTPEAEHKLLNGGFPGAAGSVGAPGTPAIGAYALADLTGDGWENLYFQGNLSASAVDAAFAGLQAGASYDDALAGLLDSPRYFGG